LRDVPLPELGPLLESFGEPAYRGRQLAAWLHRAGALSWDAMTNLPIDLRARLAEQFDLQALELRERLESDDGTRKFLFGLRDGAAVESVIIPMENHLTFCLSSQVGCAMACRFCATARGGLVRNLQAAEILEQVIRLADDLSARPLPGFGGRGFNIVLMGMGEPLANWLQVAAALTTLTARDGGAVSPRRVTISTSGYEEGLRQLLRSPLTVGLTISVNAVTPAMRRKLMPVPGRTPLAQVLALGERYALRLGRKITLAYVLIAGANDNAEEARQLAALVARRPFKVNLIPLNRLDEETLRAPDADRVLEFQRVLIAGGVQAYIRVSGGQDIAAACGQLRRRRILAETAGEARANPTGASDPGRAAKRPAPPATRE
jgi:23S rRNA (adenine2503-C2)-methyltransferase